MVTKTIKFTVRIPDWLYRYRWKNVKGWLLFYIKPYRCADCGTRMNFSWFDIWLPAGKLPRRLGVSYNLPNLECLCPKCTLKRLDTMVANPLFDIYQEREHYNIQDTCDVCGEKKTSYKAIRMSNASSIDSIRFCTGGSWNGHHVCLDCTKTAFEHGEMSSSIYMQYRGKSVPQNGRGLPVVDGHVKFPDR